MEETQEQKFSVEQLVAIGDAIHNCNAAFIIANNEVGRKEHTSQNEALFCMKGNREQLVELLVMALKKDQDMRSVMQDAMTILAVETLSQVFGKKD